MQLKHDYLLAYAKYFICLFEFLHLLTDPAETSIAVSFTSSDPVSESDQPPDDCEAHHPSSDQRPAEQPESSSSNQCGHQDQKPESKLWQATIKRSPSVQASDASAAPTTADPRKLLASIFGNLALPTTDGCWQAHTQHAARCNRSAVSSQSLLCLATRKQTLLYTNFSSCKLVTVGATNSLHIYRVLPWQLFLHLLLSSMQTFTKAVA